MTEPKDFFFQPITRYVGNLDVELHGAELATFITKLHNYVADHSLTTIQKSNFFYWLTYALNCAVKSSDNEAVEILSAITIKILNRDSGVLEAMFQQSARDGAFQDQSFFYVWMDNYSSLIYGNVRESPSLLALDFVFNKLLETPGFKFCSLLVMENEGRGSEGGKNPLLALLRALLQSVTLVNNRMETALIAELFLKCMQTEPVIMGEALTKEFTRSLFKGKSSLYVLCSALLQAGRHDSNLVTIIQGVLLQVLDTNPQPFLSELYKINTLGPYQGLSALHLILLTLVEAAYIKDNSAVLAELMMIISRLDSHNLGEHGKRDLMLLEPIKLGEYRGLNGIMFLTRALIAGIEHNLDVAPIAQQIEQLIKVAPAAKVMFSLSQNNPENLAPEYAVSPLMQLIKQVEDNEPAEIPPYLINIFNSIPDGLLLQLNKGLPQAVTDKLNNIYEYIGKRDPAVRAKVNAQDNNFNGDMLLTQHPEPPMFFANKKPKTAEEPSLNVIRSDPPKRQI